MPSPRHNSSLMNGANCYPRLCELFRAADERYNSGLFHFASDKARPEEPDGLTLKLGIDDKTLKDIVGEIEKRRKTKK